MSEKMQIALINAEQTYPLRRRVLRPGKGVDQVGNPGDHHPETIHIAAIVGGEIAGIMTIMPDAQPGVAGQAWRIRGMATAPEFRGCGFGKLMVEFGIEHAIKTRRAPVWCNAREIAFGFYEKLGFVRVGGLFDIEDIGVHSVMMLTAE